MHSFPRVIFRNVRYLMIGPQNKDADPGLVDRVEDAKLLLMRG